MEIDKNMTMMFDTHAHYDDARFDEDRDEILSSLRAAGVGFVTNIGCTLYTNKKSAKIADKYDFVYTTAGMHPNDAVEADGTDGAYESLRQSLGHPKCVAIGETGLDYHYDQSAEGKRIQKKWFYMQMELARELKMPVIIHDREAHGDCMDIIREYPDVFGIFHSYSGSPEMAKELVKNGWYISFSGVVTFKNAAKLPEVAKNIPLERILIETDAPYLAPHPMRGKRNYSAFMNYTAGKIAEIRGLEFGEICRITTENAKRIYRISDDGSVIRG